MSQETVPVLKVALRKQVLAASKAACKLDSTKAWRLEQSLIVCDKLWKSPFLFGDDNNNKVMLRQQQRNGEKHYYNIGLYMPLWFELDVEPLIRKLLRYRTTEKEQEGVDHDAHSTTTTTTAAIVPRVFVPEVFEVQDQEEGNNATTAEPSTTTTTTTTTRRRRRDMRFVEIKSERDLDENFTPVPPYNIREPPSADRDPLLDHRTKISAAPTASSSSSPCLDLLIVPGVAFDFQRNRLGKGGGFYDRYIVSSKNEKASSSATTTIGVAFDEQLPPSSSSSSSSWWRDFESSSEEQKSGEKKGDERGASLLSSLTTAVPMDAWDMPLDGIVTPSHFVLGS